MAESMYKKIVVSVVVAIVCGAIFTGLNVWSNQATAAAIQNDHTKRLGRLEDSYQGMNNMLIELKKQNEYQEQRLRKMEDCAERMSGDVREIKTILKAGINVGPS